MKKYMIPICMVAGALIGLVIGLIVQFAWQVFVCVGAGCGIVAGAIVQIVWNQTLPDAYFEKREKKSDMDTSLFAEEEVALREVKTVGHTFHEKNVEEEEEDEIEEDEEALAARAEQARRAEQRRQWEALRAQRQQEETVGRTQPQRTTRPQTPVRSASEAQAGGAERTVSGRRAASEVQASGAERTVSGRRSASEAQAGGAERTVVQSGKRRVIIEEDDD